MISGDAAKNKAEKQETRNAENKKRELVRELHAAAAKQKEEDAAAAAKQEVEATPKKKEAPQKVHLAEISAS
jgi:hypothetical protein